MEQPKIIDQQGQEKDWNWLVAQFGPVTLERGEAEKGSVYRIVKIQDCRGPAVQVVNVADQSGKPCEGVRVIRYWPDAPPLPAWSPPTSVWRNRGVFGETNSSGDIGYGMGQGDYYSPPACGASAVWVGDPSGPSDFISGLGMVGGTAHRHLDVFFQLQPVDGSPEEPPKEPPDEPPEESPEERWQRLFDKLDLIIEMLEEQAPH